MVWNHDLKPLGTLCKINLHTIPSTIQGMQRGSRTRTMGTLNITLQKLFRKKCFFREEERKNNMSHKGCETLSVRLAKFKFMYQYQSISIL